MSDVTFRRAEQGDLPELLAMYNHYVVNTAITFDLEPRTLARFGMGVVKNLQQPRVQGLLCQRAMRST